MATKNFPGVVVNVRDNSFLPEVQSNIQIGLVGVAEKGPFDTEVLCRTSGDFVRNFGRSIDGTFVGPAMSVLTNLTDGCRVVRVGRRYRTYARDNASGNAGDNTIRTVNSNLFSANDYIRITQVGKATTVNARIASVDTLTNVITLVSSGAEAQTLADNYVGATIDQSPVANAANESEGFLEALEYTTPIVNPLPSPTQLVIVGNKNAFECEVINAPTTTGDFQALIAPGDTVKIAQPGRVSTRELRVKEVFPSSGSLPARILFETSFQVDTGYQPLPLQDNYTADAPTPAYIQKAITLSGVLQRHRAIHVLASSAGTWANADVDGGLTVRVMPGSSPDTKRFQVYVDNGLVELLDNLSYDPLSANYIVNVINSNSSYIRVSLLDDDEPAANTLTGWNAGNNTINVPVFGGGFNGENASTADYIGTINPSNDQQTGIKVFEDNLNSPVNIIACPGRSEVSIAQEAARICRKIHAFYPIDIPQGLNLREATDWHNGVGIYANQGRLDDAYAGYFWNWGTLTDSFDGISKTVPPSIGYLRCVAYTFDAFKAWFAAAGDTRGRIPEFSRVEYDRVSEAAKEGSYGNGNVINSILSERGSIVLMGNRTAQRTESKLSAINNLMLVNTVVRGLAVIGRSFVFDPNDPILLTQLNQAFVSYLESVRNQRGLDAYVVTVDASNNPASVRNNREAIVDLQITPTDALEHLTINATVTQSGATINSIG